MSSWRELSGLTASMMNPRLKEDSIRSSPSRESGTQRSHLRIRIGELIILPPLRCFETVIKQICFLLLRMYYIWVNVASLNQWRRARGFSTYRPSVLATLVFVPFVISMMIPFISQVLSSFGLIAEKRGTQTISPLRS